MHKTRLTQKNKAKHNVMQTKKKKKAKLKVNKQKHVKQSKA